MARTGAKSGFGTLLKIGDGATPTEGFTTVAEVQRISGAGGRQWNFDDATHMESPNQYKEEIPTLKQAMQVTVEINYRPDQSQYSLLETLFEAGTLINWRCVYPVSPAKRHSFSGYIASISPEVPKDGKMSCTLEIAVQGKPVLELDS